MLLNIFFIFLIPLCVVMTKEITNLCEICDCLPKGSHISEVTDITCSGLKELDITLSNTKTILNMKTIKLINIKSLQVADNAFSNNNIRSITIDNIDNLIWSGRYKNLEFLTINNVKKLEFAKPDILNGNDLEIAIKNVNIPTMLGFPEVRIKSFKISNSIINTLSANSFHLESNNITIINSKINNIEKNAVVLSTPFLDIEENIFGNIFDGGVKITSEKIIIRNNTFFNTEPQSFEINTNNIKILKNRFKSFYFNPIDTTKVYNDLYFINNIVGDIDLEGMIDIVSHYEIHSNYLQCKCSSQIFGTLTMINHLINVASEIQLLEGNKCFGGCGDITLLNMYEDMLSICESIKNGSDLECYKKEILTSTEAYIKGIFTSTEAHIKEKDKDEMVELKNESFGLIPSKGSLFCQGKGYFILILVTTMCYFM